jgi:hypothetical protein
MSDDEERLEGISFAAFFSYLHRDQHHTIALFDHPCVRQDISSIEI